MDEYYVEYPSNISINRSSSPTKIEYIETDVINTLNIIPFQTILYESYKEIPEFQPIDGFYQEINDDDSFTQSQCKLFGYFFEIN